MTYIHNGILYNLYSQWNIIYQEREKNVCHMEMIMWSKKFQTQGEIKYALNLVCGGQVKKTRSRPDY